MNKTLPAVLLSGTLLALPATAQIYKTTDAEGNVVFTDQPPGGDTQAEQVELQPLNTTPPPPKVAPVKPPRPAPENSDPAPASEPEAKPPEEKSLEERNKDPDEWKFF